jgi:hypothetical protein
MEIQTDRFNELIADLRVSHIQEAAALRRRIIDLERAIQETRAALNEGNILFAQQRLRIVMGGQK